MIGQPAMLYVPRIEKTVIKMGILSVEFTMILMLKI